ncbi:hypothetical protein CFC21_078806 [Triticum aestivum]|uniref:Uncharacterized protein n=2 Tax=Triticum aestivum TaxID=4565 RepID=A0A9R1HYK1_WHEAT|nr:hypothetical protein CFC21_078795 [Triticum aestivum]KAF7073886.1 hypothetical protein CFC21_078806 [Triticum aestivum]
MIYRSWSLLSSTVAIWGGAAAAGLAVVSLSGGKSDPSTALLGFLRSERKRKLRVGPQALTKWLAIVIAPGKMEKFQDYLCREGDRLRRQDRATMASAN